VGGGSDKYAKITPCLLPKPHYRGWGTGFASESGLLAIHRWRKNWGKKKIKQNGRDRRQKKTEQVRGEEGERIDSIVRPTRKIDGGDTKKIRKGGTGSQKKFVGFWTGGRETAERNEECRGRRKKKRGKGGVPGEGEPRTREGGNKKEKAGRPRKRVKGPGKKKWKNTKNGEILW